MAHERVHWRIAKTCRIATLAATVLVAPAAWAVSIDYRVSVDDQVDLTIASIPVASYHGYPWSDADGSVDLPEGWYPITLDYANLYGSTALYFYERAARNLAWSLVPRAKLRSTDAGGNLISGLRGEYFDEAGNSLGTVYGEAPIAHGWYQSYQGSTGNWGSGLVDTNWGLFSERLTGEIYVGAGPTPLFNGVLSTTGTSWIMVGPNRYSAAPHFQLGPGNIVVTGPNGRVTIVVSNGADSAVIDLGENTTVSLGEPDALQVDEVVGSVRHRVSCASHVRCFSSRFSALSNHTPVAVASVRGTDYSVNLDEDSGQVVLYVEDGIVDVSDLSGHLLASVGAGDAITVAAAVPEPAAWQMLLAALLAGALTVRARAVGTRTGWRRSGA